MRARLPLFVLLAVATAASACSSWAPSTVPGTPSRTGGTVTAAQLGANPARCAQLRAMSITNPPLYDPATTWNQPAACLPTRADSAHWALNWFLYANRPGRDDPSQRGAINVAFDEYSTPIYQLADATTQIKVFQPEWGYGDNLGPDRLLPWNPSWAPAPGNDHEMIIVDPATGREWGLWGVQKENWTTCVTVGNLAAGYQPGVDLCAAMAWLGENPDGTVSDFRTATGSSAGFGRGFADVLGLALLPTLDEIERGSINHALNMETFGTMFGPACTPAQAITPAAGVSCGYAVAPATRLEWADGPATSCGPTSQQNTDADRSKTVPEGMRFVADLTDADIDRWLDGRGYTGAKRATARIFAVALRDYGWIISDTSCWASSISVEGVANPTAAARWKALGITQPADDGAGLLAGLISSADQVRAVVAPDPALVLTSD